MSFVSSRLMLGVDRQVGQRRSRSSGTASDVQAKSMVAATVAFAPNAKVSAAGPRSNAGMYYSRRPRCSGVDIDNNVVLSRFSVCM